MYYLVLYIVLLILIQLLYVQKVDKDNFHERPKQQVSVKTIGIASVHLITLYVVLTSFWLQDYALLVLDYNANLKLAGAITSLVGFALLWHSKACLGVNFSPCNEAHVPQNIVKKGIYGYIRHPIYTSSLIFYIGLTICSGSLIALASVVYLFFYYRRSVILEEQTLCAEFADYEEYRKQTLRGI